MSTPETTTEKLECIARSMNSENINISPHGNLGVLVRYNSEEYRIRCKQQVIILARIECAGEKFAYFMT